MMLGQTPRSARRRMVGGAALLLVGGTALAATASTSAPTDANQAVTLGVKPDGTGKFVVIVNGKALASGAMSGGAKLPADFAAPAGCDLKPGAKPFAMVIKGEGPTRTYTVSCASAAPASIKATLSEALASLTSVRASVATQPASAVFPETERAHALGAIDKSIKELESQIASKG